VTGSAATRDVFMLNPNMISPVTIRLNVGAKFR
jgi:hypothetical protein